MSPTIFTGQKICDVVLSAKFSDEFSELDEDVQDECLARMKMLEQAGPNLPRPYADKIDVSGTQLDGEDVRELRWDIKRNPWRALYAFSRRKAVMLTVGCKSGFANEGKFYKQEIRSARVAFDEWLKSNPEIAGADI